MAEPNPVWGSGQRTLTVTDLHAAGEPARVVLGGLPHFPGATMADKRRHIMNHADHYRKLLLTEPRGYPCQNANLILPVSPKADGRHEASFGFVVLEQGKVYPMMSGHNAICVATALLESGMVPMSAEDQAIEQRGVDFVDGEDHGEQKRRRRSQSCGITHFTLEAPAGLISITATHHAGKVLEVTFRNQPAFVPPGGLDLKVQVPGGVGEVTVDVAYGGMWYAVVDATKVGLDLVPENGKEICRIGEMVKVACREQHPFAHPLFPDYVGPDIMVWRSPPKSPSTNGAHARNAVVMSNGSLDWDKPSTWTGMLDRSPCGTGTCAVMATMWARNELKIGEKFVHESILGTTFTGQLVEETVVAFNQNLTPTGGVAAAASSRDESEPSTVQIPAAIPTISGRAWVTQHCQVVVDPSDPFPEGFTVGDIWSS